MSRVYKSSSELVGNTPLLEVSNIEKELGLKAKVLVKLEYLNSTFYDRGCREGGEIKARCYHH